MLNKKFLLKQLLNPDDDCVNWEGVGLSDDQSGSDEITPERRSHIEWALKNWDAMKVKYGDETYIFHKGCDVVATCKLEELPAFDNKHRVLFFLLSERTRRMYERMLESGYEDEVNFSNTNKPHWSRRGACDLTRRAVECLVDTPDQEIFWWIKYFRVN